ncbi:hypothetical protein RB195_019043 [Necator americanus]|uniref:Reverse transcriptase domain-containing protein n=1 Tax=Necator americanus TaxID=51031 RepID=A0ABR1CE48_NECAM
MFSCLNTVSGVAVGEATLPIWRQHFKTLLNRLAPSALELEHVHRPTYAVNEGPPTESEVLACTQKMKNGKSGGGDGISAEMIKYVPPSGIREMTKIIRSIWIDKRISDSLRHAIIIPLHSYPSRTLGARNDEQASFRPGRSTIDQAFIVRRVIEIW